MAELNQTQRRDLEGNEVLLLQDAAETWVVERGSLALFSLMRGVEGGTQRRFLFRAEPGDLLFGLPPGAAGEAPALQAVALEATGVRRLAPGEGVDEGGLHAWRERWIELLDPGWNAPDEIHAFNLEAVRRLASLREQEARDEFDRFRERERLSRQETHEAVSELTSILGPEQRDAPRGTDLFAAAHLVGQSTGLTLVQPPAWTGGIGSIEPVDRIAEASHVRVRKVLLQDGWWEQDGGPLLAFTKEERRAVALLPRSPGSYDLVDPVLRTRVAVDPERPPAIEPHAHQFYRPLPDDATRGVELIRFALRGRRRDLLLLLGTGVAATLLGMFTPQAMALLVDSAIPDADYKLLVQIGLGLLAAALGSGLFRVAQGIATIRVETWADTATQSAVWDRLLKLQLSFFRRFSTGDLASRVTAISQIRSYLSGTTLRTLFSSVILMMNLALLLYYSPILTLVALVVAGLSCAVTIGSGAMILKCHRAILELQGKFFGLMVQLIHGVAKLRVAAAESRAFARWARAYAKLLRLQLRERMIQDTVQILNVGLSVFSRIALFAIAAGLVRQTDSGAALSTGVFLAFHVAYGTFIGAIVSLSNTVTDVMAIAILRERARPIFEALPEVNERKADPGLLAGALSLRHVVFQYQADGPIILDGVSLQADPGQFVALVGPSGSGKSTLFRLLLGFESPVSGSIYYDGQDLAGLDVHAVRRQLGVVLQNGRINAGSIFDNIVCGTQVTLNDAWEAARSTSFADEIQAMPMGMHTIISEGGTNLSGGQRQRLLLTRALVHKPRVLLLDEATSALDNQTQAVVTESLAQLNVTRVVVAHRLSTIRQASMIYVVEAGRIVQQGSFDALSAEEGLFSRLMARQMT